MRMNKKMMLAAGLLAGAAAMTGCTAQVRPTATPTTQAVQQQTAQPATTQPEQGNTAQPADAAEEAETYSLLPLTVDGQETDVRAAKEQGKLLLPLETTGAALGFEVETEETQEETQTRRVTALQKDDSRITVSYTVSDNTIRQISWQKDGLLIPVDTQITTIDDVVYVPAAFFEKAMDVRVTERENGVDVSSPAPVETPQTSEQSSGENG